MIFNRDNKKRSRGQSLVEFALIAPIFFLIIFGILEGGRLVWTYHTLNNATREGLRYAMVRGDQSTLSDAPITQSTVRDIVEDRGTGLQSANLTVRLLTPDGNMEPKSRVRVEADYAYQPIVGLIFGSGTITITSTSQGIFSR